jgi:uncharacterized repeat protein (TIGR01451 family)
LTANGVVVSDQRNGIAKPRLNLMAAIGSPPNDIFDNRMVINGDTGQLTANNLNATQEGGEPNHAGNSSNTSVWWSWTAASTGIASIDTHDSNVDTVLAVYTGTALNNLAIVAANDNDGSAGNASGVSFAAQADTTYLIAVSGSNSGTGQIHLNWSLEQQADLALVMSGSNSSVTTGESLTYDLVVTNNGPSPATGVTVVDTVPAGSIIESIPTDCTESSGTVNCSFGTLPPGGSAATRIILHFSTPGDFLNTARVAAITKDPLLSNNDATFVITDTPPAVPVPGFPLPLAGVAAVALTLLSVRGADRRT